MNIWKKYLEWTGWRVDISDSIPDKCVICVAPHTSNWDFILGLSAYRSIGRKANFLMKKFWFFFPMKYLMKALGGIPVPNRSRGGELTNAIIERFNQSDYINLAVTPEGTRSLNEKWRTGFLYIAYGAKVPVMLGVIDYKNKVILIQKEYHPSGNIDHDMGEIKAYYAEYGNCAKFPDKFNV